MKEIPEGVYVLIIFLLPAFFGFLFYPWVRKTKRTRHSLLLVSTVLPMILFILRRIIDPSSLEFDEMLWEGMAMIAGISLVSLYLTANARWLDAYPHGRSFFRDSRWNRQIHFRHLLQMAMQIEERGHSFYKQLVNKMQDPAIQKLCKKLAENEVQHRRKLDDIFAG